MTYSSRLCMVSEEEAKKIRLREALRKEQLKRLQESHYKYLERIMKKKEKEKEVG